MKARLLKAFLTLIPVVAVLFAEGAPMQLI